jgi:hypothetical protein
MQIQDQLKEKNITILELQNESNNISDKVL